jgi:hypothetical protein
MIQTIHIQDRFFSGAQKMRREFETRFADPRQAGPERFVWDYWNVEGQYSLMRTPAARFFEPKLLRSFYEKLLTFGREQLGCAGISPPWISYYIDGCYQGFHSDVPHGPWAYVFSLTPWKAREFRGGETVLLRPEVLDFWNEFKPGRDIERDELELRIPAEFNRLTVFDPRIPHRVERVTGVRDPLQARLVVHGWFTEPQPFIEGALSRSQFQKGIEPLLQAVAQHSGTNSKGVHGTLCIRFQVAPNGRPGTARVLTENLKGGGMSGLKQREQILNAVAETLKKLQFPRSKGRTKVTLPLLFR